MKKRTLSQSSSITAIAAAATLLTALAPANADSRPIRQRQQSHLLGYSARFVDRSYQGIGAESGLLTNARVITKASHATPDFILERPPYTTTPVN